MFDTNKVVEGLNPTQGLKVGASMARLWLFIIGLKISQKEIKNDPLEN